MVPNPCPSGRAPTLLAVAVAAALTLPGCRTDYFTIVVLPDTQYYSRDDDGTYEKQAQWIVEHKDSRRIAFVIHMGDITHTNDPDEWTVARRAHDILDDAGIPCLVIPGNHDYADTANGHRDASRYNASFPPAPAGATRGHMGSGNENNYALFEAEGLQFLVIGLEFAPRRQTLCWADEVIQSHPDRRVIIVTHCYQDAGGDHRLDCAVGRNVDGGNGRVVFDELVKRHSNVFLVLSGHISDSEHKERVRAPGDTLHEVLTDYQTERRSGDKHGNGWLRTLMFMPAANRVYVRSLSVLDGVTEFNCCDYSSDPAALDHRFNFHYDMSDPPPAYQYDGGDGTFYDMTVNSDATRQQIRPSIGADAAGNFVVVWEDDSRGALGVYEIHARGFYAGGCERFGDFTINDTSTGQQLDPDVAVLDQGDFVVVWEDDRNDNAVFQIRAAGFSAGGARRHGDITVNAVATGQQHDPAVAAFGAGSFVVVWEDDSVAPHGTYQIHAAGFDATGQRRFGDIAVNSVATGQQLNPRVAAAPDGSFVVVWEDDRNTNGVYQIRAAGFGANGARRFGDITVNQNSAGQQVQPDVGVADDGSFVVVWQDDSEPPRDTYQIFAAGFSASGGRRFADRTVNQDAAGQQLKPRIAVRGDGSFNVVWEDDSESPPGTYQIYLAAFDASGNRVFGDETINGDPSGQQLRPVVALPDQGPAIVAWQDDMNGNAWYQVMARGVNTR